MTSSIGRRAFVRRATPGGFSPPTLGQALLSVHRWFDAGLILLMTASVFWLVWRMVRAKACARTPGGAPPPQPARAELAFVLMWYLIPVLTLAALSHVWRPCHFPRYSIHCSLALYVAVGGALASIPRAGLRTCAVAALAVLYAYQGALVLPGPMRTDWRSAARLIMSNGSPDDLILVDQPLWAEIFLYNMGDVPNPVAVASRLEALCCDEAALFLEQCALTKTGRERGRSVWIVIMRGYLDGPSPEMERCLRSRMLTFTVEEFKGERHVLVYRVGRGRQAGPIAAEQRLDGPSTHELAEAIARESGHPSVAAFNKTIQRDEPDYAAAFARLGMALAEKGDVDAASAGFRKAISLNPGYAVRFVAFQVALSGRGDYEEAIDAALNALDDSSPGYVRQLAELLPELYDKGRDDRVIEVARKLIEREPRSGRAYSYLGLALQRQGAFDEAIPALRKALELGSEESIVTHVSLGALLRGKGEYIEACAVFRRGIERHPDDPWLRAGLATTLAEQGDYEAAIPALEAAAQAAIDPTPIRLMLGEAIANAGDHDRAVRIFNEIIEGDPGSLSAASAYAQLGMLFQKTGAHDKAIRALRKALELNPDEFAPTYISLGTLLRDKGAFDEACAVFRKGIERHPKEPWLHAGLGAVFVAKGDRDSAIAALQKAVEVGPGAAPIWVSLGEELTKAGDYEGAVRAMTKAVELDPGNPYNCLVLWQAFVRKGDEAAAREAVGEACARDSRLAAKVGPLFRALYEIEDYDAARAELDNLSKAGLAIPHELAQRVTRGSPHEE